MSSELPRKFARGRGQLAGEPVDADVPHLLGQSHRHDQTVKSFVLRFDKPMPWETFTQCMEVLTALRGPDLLRVKGFLNVKNCNGPVVVQFVQHLAHPPVELQRWPDDNRQSRVVFITRNISERQVRGLLEALRNLV